VLIVSFFVLGDEPIGDVLSPKEKKCQCYPPQAN